MSFADSWYRASCALLLLTLHFSMFSFYLPLSFSLSLLLSLSLSLSFSLSLFISPPLFLSVVARHMSSDALYQIFSSWSILLFHTISFHSSYKIHQLFTDYLLRLPSSELLEKHLFRARANRRLVVMPHLCDAPTRSNMNSGLNFFSSICFSKKSSFGETGAWHSSIKWWYIEISLICALMGYWWYTNHSILI